MGLSNLITAFQALGLEPPCNVSQDIDEQSIAQKITNPALASGLGGRVAIPYIQQAETCANLLDAYSESGNWAYVVAAQAQYTAILRALPEPWQRECTTIVGAIFNYFSFEQVLAIRIPTDTFSDDELVEYLLRRGSDSLLYGWLLARLDNLQNPGLTTALRYRQALWDFHDDLQDLEQDRLTTRVNIILLTHENPQRLRQIAHAFGERAIAATQQFPSITAACEKELSAIVQKI